MVDLVSLDDARRQVRLPEDDTSEDVLLGVYIAAAARACEAQIGFAISEAPDGDRAVVKQAMLMMIAHWFDNRDAADVPGAATWLLGNIRNRRL